MKGKIKEKRYVKVEELKPYENNAKVHSEDQIEDIAASIRAFGFISPCIVDEDLNILAGHGRLVAAMKLGIEEVPCVVIEGLTDQQKRAFILEDNRLVEMGGWNEEILAEELERLGADEAGLLNKSFEEYMEKLQAEKKKADEPDYFSVKITLDMQYRDLTKDYTGEELGKMVIKAIKREATADE